MKKILFITLFGFAISHACDTEKCQNFMQAASDFKKVYNIKKLDRENIRDSLEKSAMVMDVTDSFCDSYSVLSVSEIVSLQTKIPQFSNINEDMNEQCVEWNTGKIARAVVQSMHIFINSKK